MEKYDLSEIILPDSDDIVKFLASGGATYPQGVDKSNFRAKCGSYSLRNRNYKDLYGTWIRGPKLHYWKSKIKRWIPVAELQDLAVAWRDNHAHFGHPGVVVTKQNLGNSWKFKNMTFFFVGLHWVEHTIIYYCVSERSCQSNIGKHVQFFYETFIFYHFIMNFCKAIFFGNCNIFFEKCNVSKSHTFRVFFAFFWATYLFFDFNKRLLQGIRHVCFISL